MHTEIFFSCSEDHSKHINTLFGQKAEIILSVKAGVTYVYVTTAL
jgi:hypothetical protein